MNGCYISRSQHSQLSCKDTCIAFDACVHIRQLLLHSRYSLITFAFLYKGMFISQRPTAGCSRVRSLIMICSFFARTVLFLRLWLRFL